MEEEQEKTGLKQDISDIKELLKEKDKPKEKKFKLPFFKARVSKGQLRRGYVTVEIIGDNKEIDFTKVPIIDGTIKIGNTIHAVSEDTIFTYKGKPFLHQAKSRINPFKLQRENETYGQKYVMARMKSDIISEKKKIGWGVSIFGLVILVIIVYSFVTGG